MLLLFSVAMTGCALHSLTQTPIANSPNVSLNQNNFHVVKHVQTSFSYVYVFGIGGASRRAMEKNAVADMIIKAELTGSQTVVNIVTKVSRKLVLFPIFEKVEMTVQGTVIEFDGPSVTYMLNPDEKEIEHRYKSAVQDANESIKKEDTTLETDKTAQETARPSDNSIKFEKAEVITVQEETVSTDTDIKKIEEIIKQMENTDNVKELRQLATELDIAYRNCSNKNDELRTAYLEARRVFYRRSKAVKKR